MVWCGGMTDAEAEGAFLLVCAVLTKAAGCRGRCGECVHVRLRVDFCPRCVRELCNDFDFVVLESRVIVCGVMGGGGLCCVFADTWAMLPLFHGRPGSKNVQVSIHEHRLDFAAVRILKRH
jgi:hypothetical protein